MSTYLRRWTVGGETDPSEMEGAPSASPSSASTDTGAPSLPRFGEDEVSPTAVRGSGGGGGGAGLTQASASSGQRQGSIPFFANRQQQRRTPAPAAKSMTSSVALSIGSTFDANGGSRSSGTAPRISPAASTPRTEAVSPPSSDSSAPSSAYGAHNMLDDSSCDRLPPPRFPPSPPSQLYPSSEAPPVDGGNGKRRMLLDADVRCADAPDRTESPHGADDVYGGNGPVPSPTPTSLPSSRRAFGPSASPVSSSRSGKGKQRAGQPPRVGRSANGRNCDGWSTGGSDDDGRATTASEGVPAAALGGGGGSSSGSAGGAPSFTPTTTSQRPSTLASASRPARPGQRRQRAEGTPAASARRSAPPSPRSSLPLEVVMEDHDPFEELLRAEEEVFATAAARIQKATHLHLNLREGFAREHACLLKFDVGFSLEHEADRLLDGVRALLAKMGLQLDGNDAMEEDNAEEPFQRETQEPLGEAASPFQKETQDPLLLLEAPPSSGESCSCGGGGNGTGDGADAGTDNASRGSPGGR